MGVDNIVVTAFALVVLLLFSAVFIEHIAPMFAKARFDELCRSYLLVAEANNGLTRTQITQLGDELSKMGLVDITIKVDDKDSVARRKLMSLDVECKYVFHTMVDFLHRGEKELLFTFERHFMARRIVE